MKSPLEQAAQWFMQLQESPRDESLQARFERWIWANPAHARAYKEVCDAWDDFDSDHRLGRLAQAASQSAAAADTHRQQRRRTIKHLSVGALAALAAGGVAWQRQRPDWQQAWHTQRAQPLLDQTLPDGTSFDLGPSGTLQASYRKDQRQLQLEEGALLLQVAADPQRPFTVRSRNIDVLAQDSRLALDRWHPDRMRISLESGKALVTLNEPRWLGLRRIAQGQWPLTAGQVLDINDGHVTYAAIPASDASAWRQGVLVFSDASLEEIAAKLSRFAELPVRAPAGNGPAGNQPRIAASVRLKDISTFLASLPELARIRVRHLDDHVELLPA